MAEKLKKFTMRRWNGNEWDRLHPRTSADIVEFDAGETDLVSETVEDAIQEVWGIVDAQVLDWTVAADVGTAVQASTDETIQYSGDGKLIETVVSQDTVGGETTTTITFNNTLTPNLVAGDLVISPTNTNIGRLGIGAPGQTLRVSSANLPEWTSGGTVDEDFVVKFDSGTTEDTDLYTFDGGTAKTIDIKGGTGVTLTKAAGSITIDHTNSVTAGTVSEGGAARTLANGGSFNIPSVTFDAQGHITSTTTTALDLPTYVGGTYLTLTNNTFDHDNTTRTDTANAASPGFEGTFDVVDSVTTNATGHVTAINVKTVTVPTETTLSKVDAGSGTWLTGLNVSDHEITLSRSDSTDATITVGELIVSDDGDGNGNLTIDGILRGPTEFIIDASPDGKEGTVIINGDLVVKGDTTTVHSQDVTIGDAFIKLNFDPDVDLQDPQTFPAVLDAGIEVERYSLDNVRLFWNETEDDWVVTNATTLYSQTGDGVGEPEFTQFTLFHEGNFTIPLTNTPITSYAGPVYAGAMVYEVTETINL